MPFDRKTLSELKADVAADIASSLPGTDPLLRYSPLQIIGAVLAGLSHLHYGYLDWISKQAVPYTATEEFLEAWAGLRGVYRKAATSATGQVTFTGTPSTDIPSGTPLVRGDGLAYVTTADATVGGGGTVAVAAVASAGASAGNCDTGTILTLGTVIAGIQSDGTVTTAFTAGTDVESDDSLRSRMLEVYAAPPNGGDAEDYVEWALQLPSVTRVWCVGNGSGVGTVDVYFMMDVTESVYGGYPQGTNGVASAETRDTAAVGDQLTVANYLYPLRPVTALVYAKAPTAHTINFTIANISTASTATKNAIAAAIDDVFFRNGTPTGTTINLGDIEAAIDAIPAATGFVISSPSANITNSVGQLPKRGTMTYT